MKKLLLCLLTAGAIWQTQAQCWEKISYGLTHSAAIKSDGTLWTWGNDSDGQLGYYSPTNVVKTPVNVGNDTDWVEVGAGGTYTAAIKSDGSLWIWGTNINMWYTDNTIPHIATNDYDWKSISAGATHLLAIKNDGTLWKWNVMPQSELLPEQVGTDTDWVKIAAGNYCSAAIKEDGTLWTWGSNEYGQLGYEATGPTTVPAQVGTATDWKEISARSSTMAAIKTNGTLWFWGDNADGEFGNGTTSGQNFTPAMTGTDTNWKSVSIGYGYTLALKNDDTLWGWGAASIGITPSNPLVPVMLSSESDWVSISAGSAIGAVDGDAVLWSAGGNAFGQVGVSSLDDAVVNITMVNCSEQFAVETQQHCWKTIASGGFATVAIAEDGTLWGWGSNMSNPLGDLPEIVAAPTQIGTDTNWKAISMGNSHVVALKTDGTLWAWGRNDAGQVGNGDMSIYNVITPTQIGTDTDWVFINASGGLASAAIKADGTLWKWGYIDGEEVEIVDGLPVFITTPTLVGTDTNWKYVDIGHSHVTAIKTDGTLWAWGNNGGAQLGLGNTIDADAPVQVGTDTDWKMVKASNAMTAALKNGGTLWTWGQNTSGSLGNGVLTAYQVNVPTQVGTDTSWKDVDLGMNYFCGAIKTDGSLWTWGYNLEGSNGHAGEGNIAVPTILASDVASKEFAGGGEFSVALKEDGSLWTWGSNWYDQLGFNIGYNAVLSPTLVTVCDSVAALPENDVVKAFLYPNPTSSNLTLANAENLTIENLSVTDMTGKLVLSQKGKNSEINVEVLPAGIYFLNVSAQEGTQHLKFVKE